MYRNTLAYLHEWKERTTRKPLVIRGARQVGKSYLVSLFAKEAEYTLLEINFDFEPETSEIFHNREPQEIITLLELKFNQTIIPEKTLLFLDEIQAAPEILASLRYFYEKMPQLRVIATGSLLEFVLEEHSFSMPVGRIEYLHLSPMLFDEFLLALGKEKLLSYIRSFSIDTIIPEPIHKELLKLFQLYLTIGGMPEVVKTYAETGSFRECEMVKSAILQTYKDDFSKYQKKVNINRLQKIFTALPSVVSEKIKYVNLDRDEKAKDVEATLHLFELAKIIYRCSHSSANGIPLTAEADKKNQKLLYLDVGLHSHALGLNILDFHTEDDAVLINAGAVCEQFVGQHLLYKGEPYREPELHYWVREKKGSSSEVDFVVAHKNRVVPVEVKAGKTGRLRSLQVFLEEKKASYAVRFNTDLPTILNTETVNQIEAQKYTLLSLPFYLIEEMDRLLEEISKQD